MPFKKGQSGNPKGMPKGTKMEKTKAWEKLGSVIINEHAERFMSVMEGMDDEDFVRTYLQTLEYFKPKQQRREIEAHVKNEIDVSAMSTDELKQRAIALTKLNESSNTNIA